MEAKNPVLSCTLKPGSCTIIRRQKKRLPLTQGRECHARGEGGGLCYLNGDGCLLVLVGGEDLRLLGGDDGVPGNQLGHDPAHSLNAQGERRHIEQEQVCRQRESVSIPTMD